MHFKLKLILVLLCWQNLMIGQSFMKEMKIPNSDTSYLHPFMAGFGKLQTNGSKNASICVPNNSNGLLLVDLSLDSLEVNGYSVHHNMNSSWTLDYNRIGDFHLMNSKSLRSFILLNPKTNQIWGKRYLFGTQKSTRTYFSKSENIYACRDISGFEDPNFLLSKLNFDDGQEIWSQTFRSSSVDKENDYEILVLDEFLNEDIFLSFSNGTGYQKSSGILKLNNEGDILKQRIIANDSLVFWNTHGFDGSGNVYMTGVQLNKPNSENIRDAFIAKFDSNLNLIWANKLLPEQFDFWNIDIAVFPNGDVVFAYVTQGDFPVITGKLDKDGNLIFYNGYGLFTPRVEVGQDSSVYLFSSRKYLLDGTSEPAIIFAKTNPDGTIDGCPQFDACLSVFDLDIPFTEWVWQKDTLTAFEDINPTFEPIEVIMDDYCGTPTPPNPFFQTPDTICQNICISPDNINNNTANGVKWNISGTNTNFQSTDTSFNFCFNSPGTFQIEQEVWLLGCSEFHTRNIVVLSDSLGDLLGDDRLLCEDSMAVLIPNGARPLRQFEWNDGSTEPTLNISQSGNYAITATDGFCTASDEVNLTFFKEWLVGEAFEIPKDTTVCKDLLPFVFQPTSDYTSDFFVNDNPTTQQEFSFSKEGNYQISANIEGCEIDKNFYLTVEPCEVDIYIPSSFSPNNDGINDLLEPLGKNFLGQKMEVYDRWGGKLFETKKPPFAWDGKSGNALAEEGVYVLVFSYLNLKNNREELVSGDVLVLR